MRPWLLLPTKMAHDVAPFFLQLYGRFCEPKKLEWNSFSWRGLHFPHRLGIAGGVDKNGVTLRGWWALGAGFIEVGTVTPRPQGPNPGVIIKRDLEHSALWNRMGFPSSGVEVVRQNLERTKPYCSPVFVNVGKNRTTPNESAGADYRHCMEALADVADAFVINVSSPNTAGLRELLKPENLRQFLTSGVASKPNDKPVLLKLSPDMTEDELKQTLETSLKCGLDGFILTNTTLERAPGLKFPAEGGVSGAPLRDLSLRALRIAVEFLGRSREQLVVSVGGVLNANDVLERLNLGADLVQVYSALVFSGPHFFVNTIRDLKQKAKQG